MSEPSVTLIVHTEESKVNEIELENEIEQKTKIVDEFTIMIENFAQTLIESSTTCNL